MPAKFPTIILFFAVMISSSCKKNSPANSSPVPLLTKTESAISGEMLTTTIEYSGRKLSFMQTSGVSAGNNVNIATRIIRNSQGVIEKIIIKNPAYLTAFFSDSIVYTINYSTTNNQYTSLVNNLFFKNGTIEYDSTYFTYDVEGSVIKATKLINDGSSTAFTEAERNEFSYNGANLIRCKNYISNSLYLEQTVMYDNQINPMSFDKEWILIGSTRNNRRFEQSSFNNPTNVSYLRNGNTTSTTMTFTYNQHQLPEVRTDSLPTGGIQTTVYHYQ